MTTSWYGNAFRVAGPLRGESIGYRWFPSHRARNAESWCLLCCWCYQVIKQTSDLQVIWETKTSMWRQCHNSDVIMGTMASQITSLTIVYSTVYSVADQENIKAPRHWPLWGEFSVDRWIPRTNDQSLNAENVSILLRHQVIDKACGSYPFYEDT